MSFRGLLKPQHGPHSPLKLLQHQLARLEPDVFFEVDLEQLPEGDHSLPLWVIHASYGDRVYHIRCANPVRVLCTPALQEYIVHRFQQALQLEVAA